MADGRRERGMTLVEVLVALAILGLAGAALLALIGQNSRFVAAAEAQMLAGIAADNAMVEALAAPEPLERGSSIQPVVLAGRRWTVERAVVDSGVEGVVRIDIAARAEGSQQVLARAMSLKGE